jgi:hypothetical protein
MKPIFQSKLSLLGLGLGCALVLSGIKPQPTYARDVEIKVGIVQRFGDEAQDTLTVSSLPGDRLEVEIETGGKKEVMTTDQITFTLGSQPLSQPELSEHVVLSDQGTFETAEDSAKAWQALGIEVEITQPERWQVWAKRDVYSTPLLRRLLLQSLKAKGFKSPYLSSEVLQSRAIASFVVNGYRYNRAQVVLRSGHLSYSPTPTELSPSSMKWTLKPTCGALSPMKLAVLHRIKPLKPKPLLPAPMP